MTLPRESLEMNYRINRVLASIEKLGYDREYGALIRSFPCKDGLVKATSVKIR